MTSVPKNDRVYETCGGLNAVLIVQEKRTHRIHPYLGLALASLLDLCVLCLVKLEATAAIAAAVALNKALLLFRGKDLSKFLQVLWHRSTALLQGFHQVRSIPVLIRAYEGDSCALVASTTRATNPAAADTK